MVRRGMWIGLGLVGLLSTCPGGAAAQDPGGERPIASAFPDGGGRLTGPMWESQSAGLAFASPAGSKEIRSAADPDLIVTFVNDARDSVLRVSRVRLRQPLPLRESVDAEGNPVSGVVDYAIAELKGRFPALQILRNDVTNFGECPAAMLAVRYSLGTKDRLTQRAIVQVSDTYYYTFDFTSPGARPGAGEDEVDVREQLAVETFGAVLDTLKVLDRGSIAEDQRERLFRTRTLMLNWTEPRIRKVIDGEQWYRLIQAGKDVGYTYVVEETETRGGREGLRVGVRSRTVPAGGTQVDAESWLYCSFDRDLEEWSNLVVSTNEKGEKNYLTELGTSERTVRRVLGTSTRLTVRSLEKGQLGNDPKDPRQPAVSESERYSLSVSFAARSAASEPVTRELPPFYLPQAMGHMLPRLVNPGEQKTYLFASWVSERREVMMRYVEVLPEAEVTLGGRKLRAIPVSDRIGLEGSPTMHYMTASGEYLGSVNAAAKIEVLPTDAATLKKLWVDADLRNVDSPAPSSLPRTPGNAPTRR